MSLPFIQALMEQIMAGAMIPKVQIEREVSPILGMFLEELLTITFKDDPLLSGSFRIICPEFPLKKADNRQSTNIDWLMYNAERKQLIFVELKTADTSVNSAQGEIYRDKQKKIRSCGASFLIEDLRQLRDASGEHGKYNHVLKNAVDQHEEALAACREAFIVYLVPGSIKERVDKCAYADHVLSFSLLPRSIFGPFAAEWEVIQPYLCELDDSSRSKRNKDGRTLSEVEFANYSGRVDFECIMKICRQSGDDVVVGFAGGIKSLVSSDLVSLQTRLYKWDNVTKGNGCKIPDNWIHGSEFLSAIGELGGECPPASVSTVTLPHTSNWHGVLSFIGMVDHCALHGDNVVIGFTGGREAFLKKTLVDLKKRPSYKWDFAKQMAGKKRADWIPGSEISEMLVEHHGYQKSGTVSKKSHMGGISGKKKAEVVMHVVTCASCFKVHEHYPTKKDIPKDFVCLKCGVGQQTMPPQTVGHTYRKNYSQGYNDGND